MSEIYYLLAVFFGKISIFFMKLRWKREGVYNEMMRKERMVSNYLNNLNRTNNG